MLLLPLCFSCVAKCAETVVASDVVTSATAQAAIKQAEELQLAQHETWLALLHYKRETVLGRFISQADDAVAGFDMEKITSFHWQYNLQVNHAVRALYRRTEYDFFNDEDWTLDYNYYF